VEVLKNQLHELNQLHNQLWESFKALKKEVIELKGIINYLEGNYEKLINNYIKMRK